MGKLINYILFVVGIIILLNMAGFETMTGSVVSQWGADSTNAANFQSNTLYVKFLVVALGALALGGIAQVIMGVFGRGTGNFELITTAAAAAPLALLVGDLISIGNAAGSGWEANFVWLLIIPLSIVYIIALYDWVRGKD